MCVHRPLVAAGVAACERFGYDVVPPGEGSPAVATPTDASRALPRQMGAPRPVAVEPLALEAVTPTMLVSRLWNDARHDRVALFVVPESAVDDALTVLRPPALLRAQQPDGTRRFYAGPDRIPLSERGYAAVKADAPAFDWREEAATGPLDVGDDAGPRLVLAVGDGDAPVVALDGVDALSCPPACTVPYHYWRGDDRRFHVRRADGADVGSFPTLAALRRSAYHPIPMPLVPEHVLPDADPERVADAWLVLGVPDDAPDALDEATLYGSVGRVAVADARTV
jgi:hypothetical protein